MKCDVKQHLIQHKKNLKKVRLSKQKKLNLNYILKKNGKKKLLVTTYLLRRGYFMWKQHLNKWIRVKIKNQVTLKGWRPRSMVSEGSDTPRLGGSRRCAPLFFLPWNLVGRRHHLLCCNEGA